MALPTASDNLFPKIILDMQTSTPAAPSNEDWKLFAKPDGIYARSSNTTVGPFAAAAAAATVVNAHGARVTRASGNFSVGNNTLTAVQFNAEDFDTDTMHDNVTNNSRITIPSISGVTTGLWEISASGYVDASSGAVDALLKVNGTTPIAFDRSAAIASPTITGYRVKTNYVLSATDYIECLVRTTGGSFNVVFDAGVSPIFSVAFLGKVT